MPDQSTVNHDPILVAEAWHDVTCPERGDCRDRAVHLLGQQLANTGALDLFLHRLDGLENTRSGPPGGCLEWGLRFPDGHVEHLAPRAAGPKIPDWADNRGAVLVARRKAGEWTEYAP
jgi:hypothetical protein